MTSLKRVRSQESKSYVKEPKYMAPCRWYFVLNAEGERDTAAYVTPESG